MHLHNYANTSNFASTRDNPICIPSTYPTMSMLESNEFFFIYFRLFFKQTLQISQQI